MSDNAGSGIFRKKTMDRISSPEELTDYLKVTNPGIWLVLTAVICFLIGLFVWSFVGTLETRSAATVVVKDHTAMVILTDSNNLEEGMPLQVSSESAAIASVETDDYGRAVGKAEIALPDGTYEGTVVTDQTRPIEFLTNAGGI